MRTRKPYPSDILNEERDFVASYMALIGDTEHGIRPEVVKHAEAERGFMLLGQR